MIDIKKSCTGITTLTFRYNAMHKGFQASQVFVLFYNMEVHEGVRHPNVISTGNQKTSVVVVVGGNDGNSTI